MISLINVFKQARSADWLSPVRLPKYTSCNSCANHACSDRSRCHNYGREAAGAQLALFIVLYTHRADTVLTYYRSKQTELSHICQTKLAATRP